MNSRRRFLSAGIAGSLLVLSRGAYAHGAAPHDSKEAAPVVKEQQAWGIAGDAKAVTRSIPIVMTDAMRFIPDLIEVRLGETIRFAHRNEGKVLHEMVIGTPEALAEHAELMVKFPGMEHDEPWMAHVEPGGSGEIVWTFNRAGEFEFACLIPGHFQAGMVGRLLVRQV